MVIPSLHSTLQVSERSFQRSAVICFSSAPLLVRQPSHPVIRDGNGVPLRHFIGGGARIQGSAFDYRLICSQLEDYLGNPLIAGFFHAAFVERNSGDFLLNIMAVRIDFFATNLCLDDSVFNMANCKFL